jgi:hypothetical protein
LVHLRSTISPTVLFMCTFEEITSYLDTYHSPTAS